MIQENPIILCVDDEMANLKLLEKILVPRHYEVVTALNGKDAIAKIKTQRIDLVLLDIMMPDIDGFEVCREIKGHNKYRNIPVIIITSLTAKQDRINGIEAGAEEFLSKPFDQMEVLARIKMLLTVKELNYKLNYAYDNINRLTTFGKDLINTFNPLDFDFMSKVNSIVSQIIRQKSHMAERPEIILVRILDQENNYKWYRYEYIFDKLERTEFKINDVLELPKTEDSRLLFFNESVVESQLFQSFTGKL